MPGKKRSGKIDQIRDHSIVCICPEAGELKAVAGLFLLLLAGLRILDGVKASAVGIILGVGAVADHKDLHVLKEAGSRPERIPLIPIDLIEGLPDRHAAPFQLHVDHRKPVDQDRDIVAIIVPGAFLLADCVLIDHLQEVIVNILLIDQRDVLGAAVVTL